MNSRAPLEHMCESMWSQHEVHISSVATWAFYPYALLLAVWRGCCGSLTKNHWISLAQSHSFSNFLLVSLSLSIVHYVCHGYWCKIFSKFLNTHFCLVTQYSAASHTQVKISSSKCKRKFCKAAGSSLFGQDAYFFILKAIKSWEINYLAN